MFETIHYIVAEITGDYVNLKQVNIPDSEPKLVARALLPTEIEEGSKIVYEMMEYTVES